MSWDSYIDNLIQTSQNNADLACIIGKDGGAKWTSDAHAKSLKLTADEGAAISQCFKSGDFSRFQAGGIYAAGTKYQFLRSEDNKIVLAKKKDCGALTLQCSKTAIVIAHVSEGCQQGNVNQAVGSVAEYLEGLGM